jgi:hypothetical protein
MNGLFHLVPSPIAHLFGLWYGINLFIKYFLNVKATLLGHPYLSALDIQSWTHDKYPMYETVFIHIGHRVQSIWIYGGK